MLFSATPATVPLLLLIAMAIDAAVGDPPWLFSRVPHPVAVFGRAAARAEGAFNHGSDGARFMRGAAVAVVLITAAALAGWLLTRLPTPVEVVAIAVLLAQRSLYDHVRAVAAPLAAGDLDAARRAVSHIVGRDPDALDAPAVARAAIETLAENFADGIAAPVFWYLVFGLPGLCAYKAINTLDSMYGYRNPRYEWFGKVAAFVDDIANLLPARLAGLAVVLAAGVTPRADARAAWTTMVGDAGNNPSPNAGWPEAAMAGALHVSLLGPRTYGGVTADRPWLGAAFGPDATAGDVDRALAVYLRACGVLVVVVAALALA